MTITMTKKVSACQAETVQFMSIEKVSCKPIIPNSEMHRYGP